MIMLIISSFMIVFGFPTKTYYTECKCGRPIIFCLERFSRKEKQLNNDEDQVKISHYVRNF